MQHLWIAIMLEYMFQLERRIDTHLDYDKEEWAQRAASWIDGFMFGVLGPVE